jgi:hypothetical protein
MALYPNESMYVPLIIAPGIRQRIPARAGAIRMSVSFPFVYECSFLGKDSINKRRKSGIYVAQKYNDWAIVNSASPSNISNKSLETTQPNTEILNNKKKTVSFVLFLRIPITTARIRLISPDTTRLVVSRLNVMSMVSNNLV